jgi:hypothetical protein
VEDMIPVLFCLVLFWLLTLAVDRDWMVSMGLLVEEDGDETRKKRECLSYLWNSARLNYSADDVDVGSLAKWGYEGRERLEVGRGSCDRCSASTHPWPARTPSGNFSQSGHASL